MCSSYFCFLIVQILDDLLRRGNIVFDRATPLHWLKDDNDIYQGLLIDPGCIVDVKKIPKEKCGKNEISREKEALTRGAHIDNIVISHSFEEDDEFYYVAYEPSVISLKFLLEPDLHSQVLAATLKPIVDIKTILSNAANGINEK